ncbi:sulfatase family protein [Rhizorhabdus histidinilytica]|uniref:sulfatase family protein n=1 Tax=Rhizorhabdus histidinilytica TaxID=439228 RepID=UPI0032208C82
MRFLVLLPFLLATSGRGSAEVRPSPAVAPISSHPNIVIILADDMGYGDIGANGATKIRTPNIDALARSGVNFTDFNAAANICSPSRASILTGRYPIRSGVAYDVIKAQDTRALPETEETVAGLAKRAGYRTMLIGKWHLGSFPNHNPLKYGFDRFYGVPYSNDMPDFALYRGNERIEQPVDQTSLTERYTREAIAFVTTNSAAKKPFLLFVSHNMPHIPLAASAPFKGRSAAGLYGDVVEELDASVGRIVEATKKAGVFDNTIFFFTSDNGPFFEGSTAGLKGGKGSGWEGAYRVPLVVSWRGGKFTPGNRSAMTMNFDILPTVAEVINVNPAAALLDGKSLLPILHGSDQSPHEYLYYFNNENVIGVRTQKWKYLTAAYYRGSLTAFEKFDRVDGFSSSYDLLFSEDDKGGEEYSLADRHPEIVAKFKNILFTARNYFKSFLTHQPDRTYPD